MGALGELVISLSADMAKFTSAMDKAAYLAEKKTKAINHTLGAIGIGVSVAGITAFVKATIDGADNINKMSQKIGIGVSQLSGLAHAAALSDVEISALSSSVGKFNKGIAEAAATGKGGVAEAFKALGISAKGANGELKSSDVLLKEVAGKFEGMEDGAGKTALAMAMFGKSGADMIPMLNAGSRGIQEMQDEAQKLGVVLDEQTAKSAEAFNDNLTRMTAGLRGMTTQVLARALPAMENFSGMVIQTAKDTESMQQAADTLTAGLKILASGAAIVVGVFKVAGMEIATVVAALTFAAEGEFKKAWETLGNGGQGMVDQISSTAGRVIGIWDTAAKAAEAKAPVQGKKIAAPLMKSAEEAEKAANKIQDIIKELERTVAAYDQTPTEKAIAEALAKAKGASPAQQSTISDLVSIIEARKAELAILQQATKALEDSNEMIGSTLLAQYTNTNTSKYSDLNWKPGPDKYSLFGPNSGSKFSSLTPESNFTYSQHQGLIDSMKTPDQQYFDDTATKAQDILDDPFIKSEAEKYAMVEKLMQDHDETMSKIEKQRAENQLSNLAGNMSSMADILMQGNRDQFEAGKAFAIASALVNTYMAASAAFAGITAETGGWGVALAAATASMAIATGMAQVAMIESQHYQPRALGGPVTSGVSYLVGERGPEIFSPNTAGYITPNNRIGKGKGKEVSVTNVYQVSTGVTETVRAEIMRLAPALAQQSVAAVHRAINGGTELSAAVGRM